MIIDATNVSIECFGSCKRSYIHGRKIICLQGKLPPEVSNASIPQDDCRLYAFCTSEPAADVIASHRIFDVEQTTIKST